MKLPASVSSPVRFISTIFSSRWRIVGYSMLPALRPGDRLLVDRLFFSRRAVRRGDIVVFRHPDRPGPEAVKRVVGLPSERVTLTEGGLVIDGRQLAEPYVAFRAAGDASQEWSLGESDFLLLGDNRRDSQDSRHFGPVTRSLIRGRVWYRYWPPNERGLCNSLARAT